MANISSLGVGSGLDVRGLVDQLVAAEREPVENRIARREGAYEAELSAYGALQSALSEFRSSADALSDASDFGTMQASSGDSDAVEVSASAGADPGRYDVQVNTLATSQSLASAGYESQNSVVGGGTLTFRFGDVETDVDGAVSGFTQNEERPVGEVEIDANASLSSVRDAVNDADIGVRASIINDGSGERLVFSADDSGAANGFVVDAQADTDSNLDQPAFNEPATNLTRTRSGQDAELVIDGLTVTRSSNNISDLIDGVTFDLKDTTTTAVDIEISADTAAVRKKIEGFVEAYNTLQQNIEKIAGYDAEMEQGGILQGNSAVRNIDSTLSRVLTAPLDALEGHGVRSLDDLGITTNREGLLEIDDEILDDALENSFDEVGALFGVAGLVEGDGFGYESSRSTTEPGTYDINVSALATQGSITGSTTIEASEGTPLAIVDGNELRFEIDGVRSGVVSLTAGDYDSPEALAAEIQARINGDAALADEGIEVSVGFENGALQIASTRYGSDSLIELTDIDADTAIKLGFTAGAQGEGTDVVGTINGAEAEGFGRYLTALSGPAEGLKVDVDGEKTGDLGSVTFSRGITSGLDDALGSYLDGDGIIAAATDGLQSRIDGLADDRDRLNRRIEQIEARYIAQFSAMDAAVAQMNQTSSFLSQQLSRMPVNSVSD